MRGPPLWMLKSDSDCVIPKIDLSPTKQYNLDRIAFCTLDVVSERNRNDKLRYTKYDIRTTNMCLAIPARIIELEADNAVVDAMGNRWRAKTILLPAAKIGDLVLVHAGFAISLVDEEEARKTWELFAQIDDFEKTPNKVSG